MNYAEQRVGERRRMNCGDWCTVTAYFKVSNITVQFDDGAVREHVSYQKFIHGYIKHPEKTVAKQPAQRVGEKRIMNCGMEAKIIEYFDSSNITVEFPNGDIRKRFRMLTF